MISSAPITTVVLRDEFLDSRSERRGPEGDSPVEIEVQPWIERIISKTPEGEVMMMANLEISDG